MHKRFFAYAQNDTLFCHSEGIYPRRIFLFLCNIFYQTTFVTAPFVIRILVVEDKDLTQKQIGKAINVPQRTLPYRVD